MTTNRYVVFIPMGARFENGNGNAVFLEGQRELEVWLQDTGGFRWDAAGQVMAKRDPVDRVAPPEELRFFVVPMTSSVAIEIVSRKPLMETAASYPLARFLAMRGVSNIEGILYDKAHGNGVNRANCVQLAPQYLGPAAFVVLADFGDGPLKVATFESREHVDEYRQDCWDTERAPTTPAIEVPPAFRHDRKELLVFLETVVGARVEAVPEQEAEVHAAAGPTP